MNKEQVSKIASRFSSTQIKPANARVKAIVDRVVLDLFNVIDDFDVTPEEFWTAVDYLRGTWPLARGCLVNPRVGL